MIAMIAMIAVIEVWLNDPAEWWEFWLPQSGFVGGCIAGLFMCLGIMWCTK